jgi:CheY-like chemotaxis protein
MPSELIPQYIFLDINMPILDGFQFLDEFKDISADLYPEIKIAMLTTSLNPSDLENSKQYKNVVGFIYKPLIKDELDKLT